MTGAELDVRLAQLVSSRAFDTSCAGTAKAYQRAGVGTLAGTTLPLRPATDKVGRMPLDSFIVASAPCLVVAERRVRYSCKECKVPLEIDVRTHRSPAAYERLHHHGLRSICEPRECPARGAAVPTVLEHTLVVDMPLAVPA